MKADETEGRLRELFHGMRLEEAPTAPDFGGMARTAACGPAGVPLFLAAWYRALAAAAVVMLCAGAGFFYVRLHRHAADMERWTELSAWQASTDALLTRSSTPWSGTLTMPTDSLFENGSAVSETSQSNRKEIL